MPGAENSIDAVNLEAAVLDEADVQSLIQVLVGNPLLNPADRARIEWQNAMELFPRLRSGSAAR